MRTLLAATALLLFLASSESARADDVEMKNGRKFSGRIVAESDDEISLEWRGGVMKIPRGQIQEIRRGPAPAGTEPAPAPEPAARPGARGGSAPAPAPAPKSAPAAPAAPAKAPAGKKTAKDLLAELDAIRLERWDYVPSVVAKPEENKGYKLVGADGRETLKDALPASPDGIAELWVRRENSPGGYVMLVNGSPQMLWHRLYWHEATRDWQQVSVGESAYSRDTALVARIVNLAAKDFNYVIAANCTEAAMKEILRRDRAAPAAKERRELREQCAKAMGSESAGELLARIHELNVEAAFEVAGGKVRFARERRELLRQLVADAPK